MHEVVRAAQSGDPRAWNRLYAHHYPWLLATAFRICGNKPIARDAVQETFIQGYLKLSQLKDPVAFAGWLKTILIRYCYRYSNDGHGQQVPASRLGETVDYSYDVFDRQMEVETESKLHNVLGNLSEALRSVLLLRYFTSWNSYEQMAEILGVPVGTVRSRINQAKIKVTEGWTGSDKDLCQAIAESEEWNQLYQHYFDNVHQSSASRGQFIGHLEKDLELTFTTGKTAYGRALIEKEIDDDLLYGSRFGKVNVVTSGTMSVVEIANINSREYPDRCPENSVLVLYRAKDRVSRLTLHNSH